MIKFTENANELTETGHSLFFVNFKFELRMKFNTIRVFRSQSA